MAAEGTFPKADGDILYGSEVNGFNNKTKSIWTKIATSNNILEKGLIKFTDSIWQTETSSTTDAGVTWTSGTTLGYRLDHLVHSTGSVGVSIKADDTTDCLFTVNNGVTWTAANLAPDLDTAVNSISMVGSVAVVVGDDTANNSIYYSHDYGNNWAVCSSGPPGVMYSVSMANSLIGYADFAGAILKTVDGGDNWVDTGHGGFGATMKRITATDTDTVYGNKGSDNWAEKYVNSTGTVTRFTLSNLTHANGATSNIIKATNGNVYWLMFYGADESNGVDIWLYKYDGSSVYYRVVGKPYDNNALNDIVNLGNTNAYVDVLIENTNVLSVNMKDTIIEIDVSGDDTGTA